MAPPIGADARPPQLPLPERTAALRETLRQALAAEPLDAVAEFLSVRGEWPAVEAAVARYSIDPGARQRIASLRAAVEGAGIATASMELERALLVHSALASVDRIADLPVDDAVRRLFVDEYALYAAPDVRRRPLLAMSTATFRAATELVTLRRFPAGQLHWNVSGLERRALLRVARRDLPRLLLFVAGHMRGFGPAFFSHVNGLRRNPFVWLEEESNRSYHRMARALEQQPAVRGLVTSSWFHDPELGVSSPHLAWTNRVIVENGGLVLRGEPADPSSGFLDNNEARRRAYDEGTFRPHMGLVLWPRPAMLAWAKANPQFGD